MRPRVTAILAGGRDARESSLAASRYIRKPLFQPFHHRRNPAEPQATRHRRVSAHQPRSRVAGQQTDDERDRANFATARAAEILKSETP
jgi:hypothetical protein